MRIETDLKLDFSDVLLKPKRSQLTSRNDVNLIRKFNFKHSPLTWEGIGIIASNMDGVGTFSMAKELQKHKMLTVIIKHYNVKDWQKANFHNSLDLNHVSVCAGIDKRSDEYQVMDIILKNYTDISFICIDVANGYHQHFSDFVSTVREKYPTKIIIAGNVVTGEMTEELILRGADIVKIGIGGGSCCTTRTMTGVGIPQLSAIIECADAANGIGGHIIADGGCVTPGDVAKAFGAGAHFVMLGGMLAGHSESEIQPIDGEIEFYGMSSDRAMEKHGSEKNGHRGSEGKVVKLTHRGHIKDTIIEILGGVRSACTYIGAERIKDMPKCATFVRCNNQINKIFS